MTVDDASSSWRLAKAERFLTAAQRALDAGDWETAVSRSYYAAYHAVIAVFETKEGIVRATWSHNFRPYFERYTYFEGMAEYMDSLYRERAAADYTKGPTTQAIAEECLHKADIVRNRMLEVLRDA